VIPLVYSDNTESTSGVKELQRRCVLDPTYFGETESSLGWKATKNKSQPIIPAEKPELKIELEENNIIFTAIPVIKNKAEYHLEYSSMASFGPSYSNWAGVYFPFNEFKALAISLKDLINKVTELDISIELKTEEKQAQREEIDYVEVPISFYEFSLEGFDFAKRFFKNGGYKGKIPSLIYDSSDKANTEIMSPIAKVGILHTTGNEGFMARKPQFVIKICQEKKSMCKRNKLVKCKGLIRIGTGKNYFILDLESFTHALFILIKKFNEKHKDFQIKI